MATPPVVAATDGSEESTRAVEWAAREADLRGAPLRIVSAIGLLPRMIGRPGGPGFDTVADAIAKDRDRALAARRPGPLSWPWTCSSTPAGWTGRPPGR